MHDKTPTNAAEELAHLRVDSDTLDIDAGGSLTIDGVAADTLLREFGSPLYVISETTLRRNIRDVFHAFGSRWPQPVNVMYAIKANNNLAVRAIVHAEGGGGDCFGAGELHATFLAGADPARIAMNGSLKSEQEIGAALDRGVTINIDAEDEIDKVAAAARTRGVRARVNLRLKVTNDAFRTVGSDYFGVSEAEGLHTRMVAIK